VEGQRPFSSDIISIWSLLCGVPSDVEIGLHWLISRADTTLTDFYLARPYNFNMTPLSADSADKKGGDLRLERVVAFSSSACDFLRKYGFDFGRVFSHGVPYLSRSEEDACREEYNQRADRMAKIEEIPLSLKDTETMEFYRGARATITDWLKNPKVWLVAATIEEVY
jgi:hypothetical protein